MTKIEVLEVKFATQKYHHETEILKMTKLKALLSTIWNSCSPTSSHRNVHYAAASDAVELEGILQFLGSSHVFVCKTQEFYQVFRTLRLLK